MTRLSLSMRSARVSVNVSPDCVGTAWVSCVVVVIWGRVDPGPSGA